MSERERDIEQAFLRLMRVIHDDAGYNDYGDYTIDSYPFEQAVDHANAVCERWHLLDEDES